ncbi:MAG: hypothetical protein K9N10_04160 [Deltaproteobacteria bacterium]|nr:hypothetical protein [Deltaproteobacteria bacterium]
MKRIFSFLLTAILLMFVWPAYGTNAHWNYVYFKQVRDFHYTINDHSITDGQPYDSAGSGYKDGEGYVVVHAGRHGSSSVADWFKDRADVAVGDRVLDDDFPSKLNFAVYGDMVVQGPNGSVKCRNIAIGQGHSGVFNNWWIGAKSTQMYKNGDDAWLECPSTDGYCAGTVGIETSDTESAVFKLSVRTCPSDSGEEPVKIPLHR